MNCRTLMGALAAAVFAVACGRGDQQASAADSTARNLTLAAPESTAATGDVPAAQPEVATTSTPAPSRPTPRPPASRPPATRPPAASAPASYTVGAGTRMHLSVRDTITSRTAKNGDPFQAAIVDDVRDAAGRVAIPAGAVVEGNIVEVKPAPDPYTPGVLRLRVSSVTVRGTSYPLDAQIDSLETVREGRGITTGDAAKVGAGAAAGAVVGRIIGKNTRGTVIGGIVGGAVGAGVAHNTKDSDVVLPAGGHILASLVQALTVRAQ